MQQAGPEPEARQPGIETDLSLAVQDPLWRDLRGADGPVDLAGLLDRAVAAVFSVTPLDGDLAQRGCELSLVLTDDAGIREMNRTWRGLDKPTDVLSFPADDGFAPAEAPVPLGDIVLARETILRDAALLQRELPHHLSHIAVHGLLHLLGWDHEAVAEAERMEAQERIVLRHLGFVEDHAEDGDTGPAA